MDRNSNSFIVKLQQMTTNPQNFGTIRFNEATSSIQISSKKKIEALLPKYFKHGKFESFARQLNWYGFSKRNHKNYNSYIHPDLEKGLKLSQIKSRRKSQTSKNRKQNSEQITLQPQVVVEPSQSADFFQYQPFFVPQFFNMLPFDSYFTPEYCEYY